MTGLFTRDPDFAVPVSPLKRAFTGTIGPDRVAFCDATELATKLVGDAVGANLFLVGFAWQRGLLPVSLETIERAIELNGVSVKLNRDAFTWGRRAAIDLPAVVAAAEGEKPERLVLSASLDEKIARRAAFLTEYQDAAYARRFADLVNRVRAAERAVKPESEALTSAVAQSLFRLMAYKDEYEVGRLFTETGFLKSLGERFEGPYALGFHLAPPLLARRDPATGRPRKMRFGAWTRHAFRLLARARRLRGTWADPFGYTAERRMERRLIEDYVVLIEGELLPALTAANHAAAVKLSEAAQTIKGYGHVKLANAELAAVRQAAALDRFRSILSPAPADAQTPVVSALEIAG